MDPVLAWLLDPADPAVRARALVDLLDRAPDDVDVLAAWKDVDVRGSAARVLAGVNARALPRDAHALYRPKYGAPFHRLVTLAEMGVPATHPVAGALLDACLGAFLEDPDEDETCLTGNLARAALVMGRGNDPRVTRALAWLVDAELPDGGWHCWPEDAPFGVLDAWEALGAFAAVPRERRSPAMRAAVERGVDFFLERRLGVDDAYAPWQRLHWPRHYYYDVLVGLELVTALGDARDPRLRPALDHLVRKRGEDGRWRVDAAHPDVGENADYVLRAGDPVSPLEVEAPGRPSKWVTLAALRVLRRV